MGVCCFLDFETGGLDSEKHGLTEIALLAFDNQTFEPIPNGAYSHLIKPVMEKVYDPYALQLQGQTLENLKARGASLTTTYDEMLAFLHTHLGKPGKYGDNWVGRIWAHNAPFEWDFLAELEHDVYDLPSPALLFQGRPYLSCTKYLWTNLRGLGVHDYPRTNLKYIGEALGLPPDSEAHRALADCERGVAVLKAMRQKGWI
jgi:DNA polymerase III epsilon subunit-like protein